MSLFVRVCVHWNCLCFDTNEATSGCGYSNQTLLATCRCQQVVPVPARQLVSNYEHFNWKFKSHWWRRHIQSHTFACGCVCTYICVNGTCCATGRMSYYFQFQLELLACKYLMYVSGMCAYILCFQYFKALSTLPFMLLHTPSSSIFKNQF